MTDTRVSNWLLPNYDLAYVISDLHLGGERANQMFSSADQFVVLIDSILSEFSALRKKRPSARCLLVINGDFVDFLAESNARAFNLLRSVEMLDRIVSDDAFRPVFEGLSKYVKATGTRLVITLGNHDLELALPETKARLTHYLVDGQAERAEKIEYCFDGWGYRFQVGAKRALCLHGNECDEHNFTRYDELDRIIRDLQFHGVSEYGMTWEPSAGSWFVIHAVNPVKQSLPFADLLKPEYPVMATTLAVIDPTKVPYLKQFSQMKWDAIQNERKRPDSQRRMLSSDLALTTTELRRTGRASGAGIPEKLIEEMVERALAEGRIDELIHQPEDRQMLGMDDWIVRLNEAVDGLANYGADVYRRAENAVASVTESTQCEVLRRLLTPQLKEVLHDPKVLDSTDHQIDAVARATHDVVFSGHTHQRRFATRPGGQGRYINTGTWAGLITLTRAQVDSADFPRIFQALKSGRRQSLYDAGLIREECTVARMALENNSQVTVALGGIVDSQGAYRLEFTHEKVSLS